MQPEHPDRLELIWPGKHEWEEQEPKKLSAVPEHSVNPDQSAIPNRLICGDNLPALKALHPEFVGKMKCIYIDPPYNIGSSGYYEDGWEHSRWLSFMKERFEALRPLLSEDGLIFVQIDDREFPYLAVLMDEIFSRKNRLNTIAVKMSELSGVKMTHTDKRMPKLKEYILVYKNEGTPTLEPELVRISSWNKEYKTLLTNITREQVEQLDQLTSKQPATKEDVRKCNEMLKNCQMMPLSRYFKENGIPAEEQEAWKFANAWRIIQPVGSSSVLRLAKQQPMQAQQIGALLSTTGMIYLYKTQFDRTAKQPRVQVIFAHQNIYQSTGDLWLDIKTTGGVGQEGGVLFPNGKKPEKLIKRIISMCTKPGDWVLDCFAGSGTTGAVAHKMGRSWIMIEHAAHCQTHIIPRLKRVIDGTDQSGISREVGWKGGGGFTYYDLI